MTEKDVNRVEKARAGLAARVATGTGETVDQHDVLVGMTSGAED